jgi:hypothetical protein
MSWFCVLCCGQGIVHVKSLVVLVQGMVLHNRIENLWIALTSFLHVIWASRKFI